MTEQKRSQRKVMLLMIAVSLAMASSLLVGQFYGHQAGAFVFAASPVVGMLVSWRFQIYLR